MGFEHPPELLLVSRAATGSYLTWGGKVEELAQTTGKRLPPTLIRVLSRTKMVRRSAATRPVPGWKKQVRRPTYWARS